MLSVLRQLTATPHVGLATGQSAPTSVKLRMPEGLPSNGKHLRAEAQQFWSEASVVYMPEEVGEAGIAAAQ
jgi:hypothetical protein